MRKKRVYVAGPNGFTEAGARWHADVVLPGLLSAGFEPLDPWASPATEWYAAAFALDGEARFEALRQANGQAGARNAQLIRDCDAVLANLEGVDVDSGTAAEIGYASAHSKPVIAFRPDIRTSGDNVGSLVNLQVEHFIRSSGGHIADSLETAIKDLAEVLAS